MSYRDVLYKVLDEARVDESTEEFLSLLNEFSDYMTAMKDEIQMNKEIDEHDNEAGFYPLNDVQA